MNTDSKMLRKVSIVTLMGASVEWYCFLLYGMAAGTVFNQIFYSSNLDPYTAQILSYLSFAIGYLARPFGAMFFGHYGDKMGRKFTVIVSLCFMGVSTLAIAFIPTYAQIGVLAPILLQFFRLTQCFGLGGKWGGGILMTFENADPKERAFYGSIPQLGLPVGLSCAALFLAISNKIFTPEQFLSYGWRMAFVVSIVLIGIVMYIRLHIMETEDFVKAQEKAAQKEKQEKQTAMPLVTMFKNYWKTICLGIGTRWIDGVFYNVAAVFTLSYATQHLGVSQFEMYVVNVIFAVVTIPVILYAGKLADKIGKAKMFCIATILCGIWGIPGMAAIEHSGGNIWIIALVIILGWSIFYAGIWSVLGSLWAELFETEVRYSGISFVYHAPSFLVAGIVPGVCTYLLKLADGSTWLIGVFVTLVAIVSTLCGYALQKNHKKKIYTVAKVREEL